MAKRSKAPARPNSVQDRDALINAIARKGELDRQRADLCAVAEAQINTINQNLSLALTAIDAEIATLEADVQGFAEANRAELLPAGMKSLSLPVGDLGWRANNPKVTLPKDDAPIVAALEKAELWMFVRVEKSVDKAAILSTHSTASNGKAGAPGIDEAKALMVKVAAIIGIKIKDGNESFWFKPTTVAMPEHAAAPADALLKKVAA